MNPKHYASFFKLLLPLLLFAITLPLSAQGNCALSGGELVSPNGTAYVPVCLDDMNEGPTEITRTGFAGGTSQYFLTNPAGFIIEVLIGNPPFDLTDLGPGVFAVWSVSYSGSLQGASVGENICAAGATQCFSLSNPIVVNRARGDKCVDFCTADGGMLALTDGGTETTVCIDDGPGSAVAVTPDGQASGENTTFLITNDQGEILAIPGGTGPFDLSSAGAGTCLIWFLAYDDNIVGLEVGNTPMDFEGCYALSNPVTVNRLSGDDCVNQLSTEFVAELSGLNEVPCPVTSTGTGTVMATLNGNTLTVSGTFSGLTSDFDPNVAGGAHLHLGAAGMGGPVALLLSSSLDDDLRGGSFPAADNVFELTNEQVAVLRSRGLYVNIHTIAFAAGELRGQLLPAGADDYMSAVLLGVNENPSVMTTAMGAVTVERRGNTITVSGGFSGLAGEIATDIVGGAHIHQAIAGRNGPVIFPLTLTANDENTGAAIAAGDNSFELTDEQLEALDMDMLYVNIHSQAFRSGELRGQISNMSTASFYANLAGHQARPMAINTPGNGRVMLNFDGESTLTVSGSVSDLMDTVSTDIAGGAHLHFALAGVTGPVAFPMTITLDEGGQGGMWLPADNTFTLTPDQIEAFYARGYYVNVHSGAVQSGEVRGQVMNLAKGYFGSNLAGINANPDAQKTSGGGFMMYELCGNDLTATGSFASLATDFDANIAGGSHIHVGDAASTGGIVASLNVDIADDLRSGQYLAANNSFALTDEGVDALIAGGYYFNLHTTGAPSGEIRGQLLRDDDAFPAASTIVSPEDGARVTVFPGGSDLEDGSFTAVEDPDGNLVVYTIEIASIDNPDFSTLLACEKVGTRTTSDASIDAVYDTLIARGAFPGIEVPLIYRIVSSDGSVSIPGPSRNITLVIGGDPGETEFVASLSGVNEVPCPVTSTGGGEVTASLNGNTLTVSGSFSGLTSDFDPNVAGGAHLHLGVAGQGGPVALLLTSSLDDDLRGGTFPAEDNVFELTTDQAAALRARGLYVNIHTVEYGAGELRGQLVPAGADDYKSAVLLGVNENPSVMTSAMGGVIVERTGNTITVSGSFSGLAGTIATDIAGGAHIHQAIAGRNGPVLFPLTLTAGDDDASAMIAAADNTFELTDDQLGALNTDMLYVNVHSEAFRSGELRGQISDISTASFYANLSGHQSRPMAINTPGNGRVMLNFDGENTLTVSGSVSDLMDTVSTDIAGGAHLHLALAGATGPVAFPLTITLDEGSQGGMWLPADNTFTLTPDQIEAFYGRGYYVNVHSGAVQSGEVRGQVMNLAKGYFGSNLAGINANPDAQKTMGGGFMMYELCGNDLTATGSFANLASDFDADIAGGSHIHVGDAAETGGIVAGLNVDVADDLRSGQYLAAANSFELSDEGVAALMAGGYYFNLHTTGAPSGEIRGQLLRDDDAFPAASEIISPEDGARVTVFPGGNDLEDGSFTAVEDPDGDLVVYTIEIASVDNPDFSSVLACEKVGTRTTSDASIDAVYDTLIARGAFPGVEVPLLYRIVSSDGSVSTIGESRNITLIIGDDGGNLDGTFVATLSGLNEVPNPVTSTGSGMLTGVLEGTTLTVSGNFSGLTADFDESVAGGAHLHAGLAGQAGGIVFLLNSDLDPDLRGGTFSADSNVFELTLEQAQLLNDRGVYVNIHTQDYASGELRGQMLPAGADDYKMANLLGVNENPSVITPAVGAVVVERTGNTITVSGSFSGLMDTVATDIAGGAHIHQAIAGRNGPVLFPLSLDIADDGLSAVMAAADNIFELTDEQAAALDMDMFYVNVHSGAVRSGELRGQIKDQSVTSFYANLAGHQARPMSVNTPGNGRVLLNFDGVSTLTVSGSVNGLMDTVATAIAGGAHIHLGLAGSSGPVVFPLTISSEDGEQGGVWLPADNTFDLTPEQVAAFYAREYYVNVHTGAELSGEVRGQVMNLAKGYYGANLSPTNAFPQPTQSLLGDGFVIVEASGNQLTLTGSFANLRSDFDANIAGGSHLHLGDNNSAGGIAFGLDADVDAGLRFGSYAAADNQFTATDDQVEALANGGIYLNIHTTEEPSGSIRGQLLRDDNAFPTAPEINSPDDGTLVVISSTGTDIQEASFSEATDPDGDQVIYILEVTVQNEPDFEEILAAVRVGTDTMYSSAFGGLYDTLIARGFTAGITIPVLYRFKAIDGSVAAIGGAQSATVMIAAQSPRQVAINEVDRDGRVELINLSNVPVDFGQLYLGGNGNFRRVSELVVVCENLIAMPGERVTVGFGEFMSMNDGELALTVFNGYSTTAELLSYVAWGEGERNGEVLASVAGLWTIGTELAAPGSATSVQLVESPTERLYAHGAPTPCADNTLSVGTNTLEAADKVSVYPNPFTQRFTLEVSGLRGGETNLQLLDINGRLISERQLEIRDGSFSFDAATLAAGTYLVRLTNEGGSSTLRVVKR